MFASGIISQDTRYQFVLSRIRICVPNQGGAMVLMVQVVRVLRNRTSPLLITMTLLSHTAAIADNGAKLQDASFYRELTKIDFDSSFISGTSETSGCADAVRRAIYFLADVHRDRALQKPHKDSVGSHVYRGLALRMRQRGYSHPAQE